MATLDDRDSGAAFDLALSIHEAENRPTRAELDLTDVEVFLDAATQHGEDSGEPDHEVGDLQDILRAAWKIMTPEQKAELAATDACQNTITMGLFPSDYGDEPADDELDEDEPDEDPSPS